MTSGRLNVHHYQFYAVLSAAAQAASVPAHWSLPVNINYATYDPGNRDIIFGGWNRDGNGDPTTWRRPTWTEIMEGVAGVHGPQMGPVSSFVYTYPDVSTESYRLAKFIHPHLPAAQPITSGGDGLFSLISKAKMDDTITLVTESTIQEVIDEKRSFYTDAVRLRAWLNAEEAAGNLVRGA